MIIDAFFSCFLVLVVSFLSSGHRTHLLVSWGSKKEIHFQIHWYQNIIEKKWPSLFVFGVFWGESRFERATGHFNSTNSSGTWMPQKSWRPNPSELQADEELDSKLVIMHCGGGPAVRMCFIPPCAAVVQHCIMLAVKGLENPAQRRQPRSLVGREVERIASSGKGLNVCLMCS